MPTPIADLLRRERAGFLQPHTHNTTSSTESFGRCCSHCGLTISEQLQVAQYADDPEGTRKALDAERRTR